MIAAAVLLGLLVILWALRRRRRKAARSVAADGTLLALAAVRPLDLTGKHRPPASRFRGSRGSM